MPIYLGKPPRRSSVSATQEPTGSVEKVSPDLNEFVSTVRLSLGTISALTALVTVVVVLITVVLAASLFRLDRELTGIREEIRHVKYHPVTNTIGYYELMKGKDHGNRNP